MTDLGTDPLFDLTGHVAVVTGGGSGIGLGFADGLARAGADVAILGRSADRLAEAADLLRAHGRRVLTLPCDVGDEAEVVEAMGRVVTDLGRLDSCFANAAADGPFASLLDTTLDDFRSVLRVNLEGAFVTLREAARHMIDLGNGGSLVATSSIGATFGMAKQLPYAASKGGVVSLMNALAVDLARHGIRANTVVPGFVDTPLTHEAFDTDLMRQRVQTRIPARRWGAGDDFAGVAVYLASRASRYHTGDTLVLDGGYTRF